MIYPEILIDKLDKVKEIHASWKSSILFEDVVKWILQFDSEDYDLAIRILEHLNFLSFGDIKNALSIAYSKLIRKSVEKGTKITNRNTLFAGLGENGKSGSMISYHFRVINDISEENFSDNEELIETGEIENIVLIDDILSTGFQASKEIIKLTEKVTPFGVKNIFLLTVCGMKDGIIKVEEETKAYTFSAIEYSTKDTVIDLDGRFYKGLSIEERERFKSRMKYYGKIAYQKQPLGFGEIGGLIAFDFNTPNTTLPLIWSDSNSWIPLFKRARRITGINSYYKQFEKKKKDEDIPKNTDSKEISIYVEGKFDEIFFDLLVREKEFGEKIGFDKVNIIALGGAFTSKNLLKQLSNLNQEYIFIFDDDPHTKRIREGENYKDLKTILMSPNIMSFFDIKEISKNEINKRFTESIEGKEVTDQLFFDLYKEFLRYNSSSKIQKTLHEFISKYLNTEKYNAFIEEIKRKLNK